MAEHLVQVHEPIKWKLALGNRVTPGEATNHLRYAMAGPQRLVTPPAFLKEHQRSAYTRVLSAIRTYGGALLCDAVGLGKTYTSLAVAASFGRILIAVPATIVHQWRDVAQRLGTAPTIVSHEALSRGADAGLDFDLIIVDEAHRFRNPKTIRYMTLSRQVAKANVLLVTATPVVNGPLDILHLLRLFLPDHGMALHGLPSLECALRDKSSTPVLSSISPLLTARSWHNAGVPRQTIPRSTDAPIEALPPLGEDQLPTVLRAIDALQFPAFSHHEARRLLRSHVLYRFHSSWQALYSTLQRHRTYLLHAADAARRGSPLGRAEVRRVFGPDDDQLNLDPLFAENGHAPLNTVRLTAELGRVEKLIHELSKHADRRSPKLERLARYLETRRDRKTIVFVNAVPTAKAIAKRLGWRRLVLVTSGQARISSGTVPLAEAIQLFAPAGNRAAAPPERLRTNVLVTTDVLSEGVNLQDADAIVHYDLPWTSLRLQQRHGRISRMGTPFRELSVQWFIPPPSIEKRLGLCRRIAAKLQYQLHLGVPTTSAVGRAQVTNHVLDHRERLLVHVKPVARAPCFAVVRGPAVAAYAITWILTDGRTHDVVVGLGNGKIVSELAHACALLDMLFRSEASCASPPACLRRACEEAVRRRLAAALQGATHGQVRSLGKSIVQRARKASKARRFGELEVLDRALQTLQTGTTVGAESTLREILQTQYCPNALDQWVLRYGRTRQQVTDVRVEAALFGDGSTGPVSFR